MQEFFFNGWTDKSLSEFFVSHAPDNCIENYQNIDQDGGYCIVCRGGDLFEIRHLWSSCWSHITAVWINNELARIVVKERE